MNLPILLTTMGTTWQIPPELYGFTNPADLDLYRNHSDLNHFETLRGQYGIEPIRELWVITTGGGKTGEAIEGLLSWYRLMSPGKRPVLRIWRVKGVDDLGTIEECDQMKEAIFRVAMHAAHAAGDGGALFSLTGGRKTMSSDFQEAAGWFGCRALLHVIDNPKFSHLMRPLQPADFTLPLPPALAGGATPLISTGKTERSALLALEADGEGPIALDRWPLYLAPDGLPFDLDIQKPFLFETLEHRRKKAGYHYSQYATGLIHGEETANFLALYSLPPKLVSELKCSFIGVNPEKQDDELAWLKKLPKADLHCHLGGIASAAEMIEIARASRQRVQEFNEPLKPWLADWRRQLKNDSPDSIRNIFDAKGIRKFVPGVPEPLCVSAFLLLFEDRPDLLDRIMYGPFCNETHFHGIEFPAYETLGDLQGSGLLQNEENIRAACRILLRNASEHNLKYLEVRCSPVNYIWGGLSSERVSRIISNELSACNSPVCKLIFIASRHGKMSKVYEHIELAKELMDSTEGFPLLRGFDLAGDENARPAGEMREALMPMMKRCLHFTIHAGEIVPADSIWEAVYHLNAERIGHGLTLKENPALLERFLDRGIALEMCPSSNFQIIGFEDNLIPGTAGNCQYPLKEYLDAGLNVTVNTDNPGISRTDPTRELHRAARLTRGGLSRWEIFRIIRNGFRAAFADRNDRKRLIREAEKELIGLLNY
ncbi:MAG: hypothetical protein V2B19_11990 [Pseudomonadota bacterium]